MTRVSALRRPRKLSKSDYEVLAQFRYLLRKFSAFSESAAHDAGLTAQQHQALLAIHGFPGRDHVTVGELAERLGVRHHSAVGLIDRLVARSLVHRARDPSDRRRAVVALAPEGRDVLERLSLAHRDELRRLKSTLSQLLAQVD